MRLLLLYVLGSKHRELTDYLQALGIPYPYYANP